MPLQSLVPTQAPAAFDVQDTTFSYDVLGRYICNTWEEVKAGLDNGGYPFDAVVIGAGMFGAYCAEKLYREGAAQAMRILLLDGGGYLLPAHIQNLPQRLGGSIGGAATLKTRDTGTENVIWGMPWISNERFPGLAYCIGGRSLFWGGWSPQLTPADLNNWPAPISTYLLGAGGNPGAYQDTEKEIGVTPTTDYIVQATLYNALVNGFNNARQGINVITGVEDAPLAVQGSSPGSGVFPFDKFSSAPFLIDALRDDVNRNTSHGDVSRQLFLLPRTQVLRLNRVGGTVTSLDLRVNGQPQPLPIAPTCAVVLANGTIEATRLALLSLGIGDMTQGSPRVGNFMAHLRSNITVRVKRSALGLPAAATDLETTALLIRGTALGRRFHLQVTAAAVAGADPEKNMWSMVPDIELFGSMLTNQDPQWIVITLRGIGEMQDQQSLNPDPARSWIDLSNETDQWGVRRAYVNLVATQADRNLWIAMDNAAFDLARGLVPNAPDIEYWNTTTNSWQNNRPQAAPNGDGFWRDGLGTTHHEAGTLFMGNPGSSITDLNGKFHSTTNAYVVGPAVFPSLGSANPSLTGISLARRTAGAIVSANAPSPQVGFGTLSLDPKDWQMVQQPGTNASVRHYGQVLETLGAYGLYWYMKEQFTNFILRVEWRIGRRDDNSGIYIRVPPPTVANPLQAADNQGHEIQIDERGFDSQTNTEGDPLKVTGAVYNLQAPTVLPPPAGRVDEWHLFIIKANGAQIEVTMDGQVINSYQSNRQQTGYIALQAHHFTSRVQFRNLQIRKLP